MVYINFSTCNWNYPSAGYFSYLIRAGEKSGVTAVLWLPNNESVRINESGVLDASRVFSIEGLFSDDFVISTQPS